MGNDIIRPDWAAPATVSETIIGRRYGDGDAFFQAPTHLTLVSSNLPENVVRNWNREGGLQARTAAAQSRALSVLDGMEEGLQDEVLSTFDALPEGVQAVLYEELSGGGSGFVKPATDKEYAEFTKGEDGKELAGYWGTNARRNISKVKATMARVIGQMDDSEKAAFMRWYENLDAGAEMALLKGLVR